MTPAEKLAALFGVDRVEAHRRITEIGIECAERRESRKKAQKAGGEG